MQYKRLIVSRYGEPGVLQVADDELPEPQPGQVRVKVLAAGVAWGDILRRRGISAPSPPFTPGYDLVGLVDRVGDGVSALNEGQVVAALPVTGGYAEFICLPAAEVVPVPADMDPAEAVCLVLNYVTAYQILYRAAQVQPSERILVHGAAGGVGTALLQLARLEGLEMYGTASNHKHELVVDLGATPIDYKQEDFVGRINALTGAGVDVVCDPIGGPSLGRSYRALRRGGRLISYGVHSIFTEGKMRAMGGMIWAFLLNLVPDRRRVRLYNIIRPQYSTPEWCREDLSKLFDLWTQGKIKPIVAERILLVEATRAHELLEKGAVKGKIVLISDAYRNRNASS